MIGSFRRAGLLFPRFDDRAPNISGALYFTSDAANRHDEWISAVMGEVGAPMPAAEQRGFAHFEDALGDELSSKWRRPCAKKS